MSGGKQRASEPGDEGLCDPPDVPSCSAEQHPGARSVPGPCEGAEDDHKGGIQLHVQACTVGGCRLCPTSEPSIDTVEREGERRYRHHDNHFLFEERATLVQLVLLNQGNEELRDASLTLVTPNHNAFHVGTELPRIPRDDKFIERTPNEQAGYPSVSLKDSSVQVSVKLGDVEPGEPTEVFDLPLRICVGNELKGRRIGLQYALNAANLRKAAKGTLRLLF